MKTDDLTQSTRGLEVVFAARFEVQRERYASVRQQAHEASAEAERKKLDLQKRAVAALKRAKAGFEMVSRVKPIQKALKNPNGEFDAGSPNHHLMTLHAETNSVGITYVVCVRAPKPGSKKRKRTIAIYLKDSRDSEPLFCAAEKHHLGEMPEETAAFLEIISNPPSLTAAVADAIARNTFQSHS